MNKLKQSGLWLAGPSYRDSLQEKLTTAISLQDKSELEKAILECEEAEFPELGPQLSLARDTLESLGGGRGGQNFKNLIP